MPLMLCTYVAAVFDDYYCYYQLRVLKVISRSLIPSAASTLVHAFVVSRLDHCSTLYHGLPDCRIGSLNRVLRTVARLVGRIPKFGKVTEYIPPPYLREFCCFTTQVQNRCCLRSDAQAELIVPRSRTATRQRLTFSVAGPATWKGLFVTLRQIAYLFITPSHSSLPSRLSCLTQAGLGALLSMQS